MIPRLSRFSSITFSSILFLVYYEESLFFGEFIAILYVVFTPWSSQQIFHGFSTILGLYIYKNYICTGIQICGMLHSSLQITLVPFPIITAQVLKKTSSFLKVLHLQNQLDIFYNMLVVCNTLLCWREKSWRKQLELMPTSNAVQRHSRCLVQRSVDMTLHGFGTDRLISNIIET